MLADFLNALFDHGHLVLPEPTPDSLEGDLEQARAAMIELEASWRLEFPGAAPEFNCEAARWSSKMLYRAAQSMVFRAIGEDELKAGLAEPCPNGEAASLHYSVDLAFRFLPDFAVLAHGAASDDPLLALLRDFGRGWPLSSVGMKGLAGDSVHPLRMAEVLNHPGLRQLYVDRVLAKEDLERAREPQTNQAIRAAIGAHPELLSSIMRNAFGDVGAIGER